MKVRVNGLTLIEVLLALAIVGIAFAALAVSQVSNLRSSSRSRMLTEAKTVASSVLEQEMNAVLQKQTASGGLYDDGNGYHYAFIDYYYGCPTTVTSSQLPSDIRGGDVSLISVPSPGCTNGPAGTDVTTKDGVVNTVWSIAGATPPANAPSLVALGEGVVDVTVTSKIGGSSITLADSVTCYDVYPTPQVDAPAPCPTPTQSGAGRPVSSGSNP